MLLRPAAAVRRARVRCRPIHRSSSSCSLSPAAAGAYGDDARAAGYDALRPAYPSELLAQAVARASAAGTLLDLGAGAGRLTRGLLAELPVGGHREVLAVEPAAAMRGAFAAEGVRCVDGCGEAIPVESGSCAAVFCGESFHWMASAKTLREVYRVLRPDGILVLLWNTRDPHASGFATQLENGVIAPLYSDGAPRQQQSGPWEAAFEEQDTKSLFDAPERLESSST